MLICWAQAAAGFRSVRRNSGLTQVKRNPGQTFTVAFGSLSGLVFFWDDACNAGCAAALSKVGRPSKRWSMHSQMGAPGPLQGGLWQAAALQDGLGYEAQPVFPIAMTSSSPLLCLQMGASGPLRGSL